ncbi:MAG: hypothetical protein PHE29_06775 [Tissierellia bacterium]|nr:hypothetical protein [Tissierellia bacterium]
MKKKILEIFSNIKNFYNNVNNKFFFGRYKSTYDYINKKSSMKEYIIKFIFIFLIITSFLFLLFNNFYYALGISFVLTIFFLNEVILNNKKIGYESYILSQLTIYTSQISLLVGYNNIYASLKEVIKFLDYPVKKDLEDVIKKIDSGISITDSFRDFNEKYNNRTITLYNQTLDLFNEHGDSDAGTVLEIISEEMNMLKIKKDKFFKYKKEWRLNFYVVVILCLIMPLILRSMILEIYTDFMASFGSLIMVGVLVMNLLVIKKVEAIYRDQSIGEGGYK